jgi:two-component system, OmpR family, phosphate regulon sensor histidine kinase PhoR
MYKTKVAIIPILNDVFENMHLKHPDLKMKVNANNDVTIFADEFHFTNIIYNLFDNSIKYCDGNPEITIDIKEENNQIKIDFIDNGIGATIKNLNFIFDKFYRIPSAKSNEVNGFGLGLYYVKKICTQHQWKIFATNNASKGITVSIIIPK